MSGDEHGWSLFWTGGAPGPSSRNRRDMAFAWRKTESRRWLQKATADAWLPDMGNSRDQTSRWQERAAIPEKIFQHEIMSRSARCSRARRRRSIAGLLSTWLIRMVVSYRIETAFADNQHFREPGVLFGLDRTENCPPFRRMNWKSGQPGLWILIGRLWLLVFRLGSFDRSQRGRTARGHDTGLRQPDKLT
jgi:hypothetical protein